MTVELETKILDLTSIPNRKAAEIVARNLESAEVERIKLSMFRIVAGSNSQIASSP
jgi:hypothetical protein